MKKYKRVTKAKELIGKTISDIYYEDDIVIVFSDDTFFYITTYVDYDGCEISCDENYDFYSWSSIKAGMITKEEMDTERNKQQELREKQWEEAERKQYEKLKAKYER